MSNMSYCRFENTLRDLADCKGALEDLFAGEGDSKLSRDELRHAKALIQACCDIVNLVAEQTAISAETEEVEENIDEIMDAANEESDDARG